MSRPFFRASLVALCTLLVLSSLTALAPAVAASGSVSGEFPDRTITLTRSGPGGPSASAYTLPVRSETAGVWRLTLESTTLSAVLVKVSLLDGGIPTLVAAAKLREPGEVLPDVRIQANQDYLVDLVPYGRNGGTAALQESGRFNRPPVACFTYTPRDPYEDELVVFDAQCSYDPDGDPLIYVWEVDGIRPAIYEGPILRHAFPDPGTFIVGLRVYDGREWGSTYQAVAVQRNPYVGPAAFTWSPTFPTRDELVVFDASGSGRVRHAVTAYGWRFGDSTEGEGALASHAYSSVGTYEVVLKVAYDDGVVADARALLYVFNDAPRTLEYRYHDFFGVPFGEWWDMRTPIYGDLPILAECFSEKSIADGVCSPSDPNVPDAATYPYTNWYPDPAGRPADADPFVYAPYRFEVRGQGIEGYGLDNPVFLPDCEALAWTSRAYAPSLPPAWGTWDCPTDLPSAGGEADFHVRLQYMDLEREKQIANGPAPDDCPDLTQVNDGYVLEATFNLTMSYDASRRLFGVSGDPTAWWRDRTRPGCGTASRYDAKSGDLEKAVSRWLSVQGNYPYDIFSAFEYPYVSFFTDILWNVHSLPDASNETFVSIHQGSWGLEVLLAHWFHYGRTNYTDAVAFGMAPQGWWGMELAWFEDFTFWGTIRDGSMDFDLTSVMQYHFEHVADLGTDGICGTSDDEPRWLWRPVLTDRILPAGSHLYSELTPYAGLTYLHLTPGSPQYCREYAYDYVPHVWRLREGETQRFEMPAGDVLFFDPYESVSGAGPEGLVPIRGPITFDRSEPPGIGTWDESTRTLTVVGPVTFPDPPTVEGRPLESAPRFLFRRT